MKIAQKVRKFTGYTIKKDYDLNNLKKYGFTKTEPKDINPWWQRPFDMDWSEFFGTWRSQLLISKEDRRLLADYEENANLDRLNETLQEMINDGVFEESEVAKRREDIENSPADCSTPSVTDSKGETE